jgi:hypothetical protein
MSAEPKPARYWVASYGNGGMDVEFFVDQLAYGRRVKEVERIHAKGGWEIDSYTHGNVPVEGDYDCN